MDGSKYAKLSTKLLDAIIGNCTTFSAIDGQYVRCGAVRALNIMLRCGCGPPQDNEVRCGAGAGLACAGRGGCGPEISARADL